MDKEKPDGELENSLELHKRDPTQPSIRLDTLPPELILHICSFLSAKLVISVLSKVCRKFKDLIENDATWKMRIFRRWPKRYPLTPPSESFSWKRACVAREEQHRHWEDMLHKMRKFHFFGAHFGSVNVVRLIEGGRVCVSGGRDGFVKLWNLDPALLAEQPFNDEEGSFSVDLPSILINASLHSNAWLWDVSYDGEQKRIYTGGFDCSIKSWDVANPSEPLSSYGLSSPVLCLSHWDREVASGCYCRLVQGMDPRCAGGRPVYRHTHHRKPVLCIAHTDDRYVVSGSEDKSLIVYDKVAGDMLKKIDFEWFPLSMCYAEGQLLVGDVNNSVHVIDPRNFQLMHTFSTGHSKKVTGVQHSLGSIVTCSTDKTIRVLEPHSEPETIAVLNSTDEVARISLCNEVLASANADDSISAWLPVDCFQ